MLDITCPYCTTCLEHDTVNRDELIKVTCDICEGRFAFMLLSDSPPIGSAALRRLLDRVRRYDINTTVYFYEKGAKECSK